MKRGKKIGLSSHVKVEFQYTSQSCFDIMYGLICENFAGYLKHKYGEDAWDQVRRLANIDAPTFSVHQVKNICM